MRDFLKWLVDAIGSGIVGWAISAFLGGAVGYKIGRRQSVIHQSQKAGSDSIQMQQGDNHQFSKQNYCNNQIDKDPKASEPDDVSSVKQKQKAGDHSKQTQLGRNV